MSEIEASARPRRADGVELLETVDGYLVHDVPRDKVHYLNPTAAAIIGMCDGRVSVAEIATLLREVFSLSEPPLAEVLACVASLHDEGMVVLSTSFDPSSTLG